jgi:hypothetical protein
MGEYCESWYPPRGWWSIMNRKYTSKNPRNSWSYWWMYLVPRWQYDIHRWHAPDTQDWTHRLPMRLSREALSLYHESDIYPLRWYDHLSWTWLHWTDAEYCLRRKTLQHSYQVRYFSRSIHRHYECSPSPLSKIYRPSASCEHKTRNSIKKFLSNLRGIFYFVYSTPVTSSYIARACHFASTSWIAYFQIPLLSIT